MVSIDLELMRQLAMATERAAAAARAQAAQLRSVMSAVLVNTDAVAPLDSVAGWLEDQVPGLRRRLALAVLIEQGTPGLQRIVAINESSLSTASPQQAAADGKKAADLVRGIERGKVPAELLALLDAYRADPYFAQALATSVSPDQVADVVLAMSRSREQLMMSNTTTAETWQAYDADYSKLLNGLGGSLGLATHGAGELALPVDYAKSWSDVITADMPPEGGRGRYGYASALGLVVAHGSWSDEFVKTMSEDVLATEQRVGADGRRVWEPRSYPQGSGYVGAVAPGGGYAYDPLAGVLSALSRNPNAAIDFFSQGDHATVQNCGLELEVNARLKYLLTERRWPTDDGDGAKQALITAITPVLGGRTEGTQIAQKLRQVLDYRTENLAAREHDGGNWFSDIGHGLLDVLGLFPVVGEIPDGVNAVWYLAEGDTLNAALSSASMIPFAGWFSTGGRWVRRGDKLLRARRRRARESVASTRWTTLPSQTSLTPVGGSVLRALCKRRSGPMTSTLVSEDAQTTSTQ